MPGLLLALGPIGKSDGTWMISPLRKGCEKGSDFKFAVRKKSERQWLADNKLRFKLAKENMALGLQQQIDLGTATGGMGRYERQKKGETAVEEFVDKLCEEALLEEESDLEEIEKQILGGLGAALE